MLMPGDGRLLGVDYALLANADTAMRGAGGSFTSYREPAWLRFSDGDQTFGYLVTIRILADDASMKGVPSLLGRDILHRWTMSYSHSRGQLEFEVESADVVLPSSGPSPSPRRQYR